MEITAEMRRKMDAAGRELVDRVNLSLRARDFPGEVREALCRKVFEYLWHVVQSYASLPVPARGVYVEYVRQDLAVTRLVMSRSLGESPRRSGRSGAASKVPDYSPPDLTADEKNQTVLALLRTEDALCTSMAGLGQREAEALAEATDEFLGVFDLAEAVVCS